MPPKPLVLALAVLMLCSAPAAASAPAPAHGAKPAASDHGGAKPEDQEAGQGNNVVLPTLIAPVVEGPRLTGYVYLSIKLTAASDGDADHLRDELPLIQDKLLRALNDSPVPAAEADSPATRDAVVKTVRAALTSLGKIGGVQTIALADYQSVPF